MTDAVVVGCGAGGAVAAYELAAAGMRVVVLEAGPWHDPSTFTGLEWSMYNPVDGRFRWPWRRETDGVPIQLQTAGVGGNTLHFIGNMPRAYPEAIGPLYEELRPYYERVEAALPVLEPETIARRDELFIAACESLGVPRRQTRDVTGPGWRLQPNAVSRDCTNCGHCLVGCMHNEAKRGTNVSYAPMAVATGNCEIRTGCFVTRVLTDPRAVEYRRDGQSHVLEAPVIVLAGGAVETPRLWLASGLPDRGSAGRNLTLHWPEFVAGVTGEDTEIFRGMPCLTRADFPGEGFIEPLGTGPLNLSLVAYGDLWGPELERRMDAYARTLVIAVFCDDENDPSNGVSLGLGTDEHGAVPRVAYRPTRRTILRRDALAGRAGEVLAAAGCDPETIHRANMPPSTIHQHGTMAGEIDGLGAALEVPGVWVTDCSALPNGLGGPNPTLTCQAMAIRTAEHILAVC